MQASNVSKPLVSAFFWYQQASGVQQASGTSMALMSAWPVLLSLNTNRSTAGCSTCDGLQPLSNQHFQASITSTLQSIVGLAVVAPVLGFYSGSCSRVLFWLLFWGLASYSCSYSCSCSGVLFWLLDRFARQMSSLLLEYLYDQH
jgi:hypothetical protein